jgi:serine protease Do
MRLVYLVISAALCGILLSQMPIAALAQDELNEAQLQKIEGAEAKRIAAIERVYGAVVAVYGQDRAGGGSGVVFHPSGLVLTNHHVIAGAGEKGFGGLANGKLYPWRLIGTDPGGDIAIIQLQGQSEFPFAPLGDSDTLHVGDWCMAMGNPFLLAEDQRPTVTLGIVSGIHRYQGGSKNLLVYGDCIQTDSSINPGNSGGPLFNLEGQVVGINGRGSFEERGRVNVGLGYAVSINQVKKFIPDLLATKVSLHGTLDAIFGMRDGKVICETLNLDSDAAQKAGLELGARLVSFEGRPIKTANQFTNLLSTYPAGWPAEFEFEVEDKLRKGVLRLGALPVNLAPPKQPQMPPPRPTPAPMPGTPPIPSDESPKPPEGEKPAPKAPDNKPPMPIPVPKPPPRKPQPYELVEPGEAMFEKINLEFARNAIKSINHLSEDGSTEQRRSEYHIEGPSGEKMGVVKLKIMRSGEFEQTIEVEGKPVEHIAFDGEKYTRKLGDAEATPIDPHVVWQNPYCIPAWLNATSLRARFEIEFPKLTHEGADKSDGRIASRIKLSDEKDRKAYLWIDATDLVSGKRAYPSKFSLDAEGEDDVPAVVFRDWDFSNAVRLPKQVIAVEGLSEVPKWRMRLSAPAPN